MTSVIMKKPIQQWEDIYRQVPLSQVPQHLANIRNSPFTLEYLSTILRLYPSDGRTLETGMGSGTSAVWMSLRGVKAHSIDLSPQLVERSHQINSLLGGSAQFQTGDLFNLFEEQEDRPSGELAAKPYDVIHHQGVLEHFNLPQIRAALAQQVASANSRDSRATQ
jgi:2-polyprenyl-3-methyl-5-hydroxy-6-metoxy-1,4-benzoquinol methylase